jgi:hypothetical protein
LRKAADAFASGGTIHWMTGLGITFVERYLSSKSILPSSPAGMLPGLGLVFLGACIDHQQTTLGTMSEMIRDVNRGSDLGVALAYVPDHRPSQIRGLEAGQLYALNRITGMMQRKFIGLIEATKLHPSIYIDTVATSSRPVRGYSFGVDFATFVLPPPSWLDTHPIYRPEPPIILTPEQTAYYEEQKSLRR